MGYIITAILTALVCWALHYIRMMEAIKIIVDATNTIEYLYEKSKTIDEAITLLDKQRYRTQYKMDDQLVTQKQVAAFIERYK